MIFEKIVKSPSFGGSAPRPSRCYQYLLLKKTF